MKVLVTGAAGFIGFHLCYKLIKKDITVIGFDNLNSYYDTSLKISRLKEIEKLSINKKSKWKFIKGDLNDKELLEHIFNQYKPNKVIHLAAQAGVRYSIENPRLYINSNISGFLNILECCKTFEIDNLLYASSSSVYGGNKKFPFSEKDPVNHPISIYSATKRSNELMAHVYSHLYKIPSTGLRFFTVYGPWGRPDMAPMIFTKAILSNKPIEIYNNGNMLRDFTYIDDVINAIEKLINKPAISDENFNFQYPNPDSSWAPHKILNIGNNNPIKLMLFINQLEEALGTSANKEFKDIQPGDVVQTFSDNESIKKWINFSPETPLDIGIRNFVKWYKKYFNK